MTVICTDGKTIACDSQETGDYIEKCQKLYKLDDGRIAGTTGDSGLCLKLIDWMNGELSSDEWYHTWSGYGYAGLLIVGTKSEKYSRDAKRQATHTTEFGCWFIETDSLVEIPVMLPAAVGSGGKIAMGAMEAGASPERAVKIAIKRDPYCGGKIEVWKIPQK